MLTLKILFFSLAKHSVNSRVEILEWFQIFSRFDTLRALALFGFRLLNKCIYFVCDFSPLYFPSHLLSFSSIFFLSLFWSKTCKKGFMNDFSLFHRHDETLTSVICYYVLPNLIDIFVFFKSRCNIYQKPFTKNGFRFKKKNGFYSWYFGKVLCF